MPQEKRTVPLPAFPPQGPEQTCPWAPGQKAVEGREAAALPPLRTINGFARLWWPLAAGQYVCEKALFWHSTFSCGPSRKLHVEFEREKSFT